MKLYFAPKACSLSPHIIMRELGLEFELIRINNKTKKTAEGGNFLEVNPKGYVAALELDNGEVLTEGPAIVQYLADLVPEANLAPSNGTWERVRLQEWLSFITSEIHGGSGPLFSDEIPEDVKDIFKKKLFKRFDFIVNTLEHQDYLIGTYSVADPYLYTVLTWMPNFSIDIKDWPVLHRYMQRIEVREAVQAAISAEAETDPV
ncbi:hypothetical protein L861_16550 [Litchfieldella anticariensis FP35 = DSM 16096]|uniref:Gst n=1 Tax=Litchfieldella anticariensis (strain DSM 16096 / CECT 5854 / CIP 108499 / LMG 22089 / FP35) TaxID=1121939 RepID=S2KMC5_LITA3|nr:glutathione transferase GstA [Halomonas anticariensis]EPC01628.1 hypothetical protein L861_16550 [Halomonas anticariensis FP35 = DSM 16096]